MCIRNSAVLKLNLCQLNLYIPYLSIWQVFIRATCQHLMKIHVNILLCNHKQNQAKSTSLVPRMYNTVQYILLVYVLFL